MKIMQILSVLLGGILMMSLSSGWASGVLEKPRPGRAGQVALSPQTYEINLDQGHRTHSYRLHNLGNLPVRARVDVINWTLDENNSLAAQAPTEHSLDQWTVITPLLLDIPPGESRVVRFSIRPAIKLPAGEYRIGVVFTEETSPFAPENKTDDSASVLMTTRFQIQSAVYVTTGDIIRQGRIEDISLQSESLNIRLASLGNAHVRLKGNYEIWPFAGEAEADLQFVPATAPMRQGRLTTTPILQGTTRTLRIPLESPLTTGRYQVRVSGELGADTLQETHVIEITGQ